MSASHPIPQPRPDVDWKTLPIGPEEAFVLSRVDGHLTEPEIAAVTGIPKERVHTHLLKLKNLGAIGYGPKTTRSPTETAASTASSNLKRRQPVIESLGNDTGHHPAAALYDPSELDEEVDLSVELKRKVMDRFHKLDTLSHYQLLEVPRDADKKAIKAAYFKIVGSFHPDRYYGKNLGSFKAKLERVFQRMTDAHDVLTRKRKRAEYDAYLVTQEKNRRLEQGLSDSDAYRAELSAAKRKIEEEARVQERAASKTPPRRISVQLRTTTSDERKRAFSRKLVGSSLPPKRTSKPDQTAVNAEAVADDLRRRYEARLSNAKTAQIKRYTDVAESALKDGDLLSASNALRIASSLDPDDQGLAERLEKLRTKANAELAENYFEQARYEEQAGRFAEAARTYESVIRAQPGAEAYYRAALCLLEAGEDFKRAAEYAKKAAELWPKKVEPRIVIARAFAQAKMVESALAEFERAKEMDPDNPIIRDWIKRLKSGND